MVALLVLGATSLEAQRKKGTTPAPLPVTANTVSPGVVLVGWSAVQKVSVYEVTRCEGAACTLKTRLSAFAPREMRDNLSANGTYLYKVTALGGNGLPLAEGQVGYLYTAAAPIPVVLMPPPSGTITPINLCTQIPSRYQAGAIWISLGNSSVAGAAVWFESWGTDPVAYVVERAPVNTNLLGGGWTPVGSSCDNPSPLLNASGLPGGKTGFHMQDLSGGLTPGAYYAYRVRVVYTSGLNVVNASSTWQAPAPPKPSFRPPLTPVDPANVALLLWDVDLTDPLTGMKLLQPLGFVITSAGGLRLEMEYDDVLVNYKCLPCRYELRYLPPADDRITLTVRWQAGVTSNSWVKIRY